MKTKAGHCEYFATATVLLLREVGVRARYVTGYAVPESAREGDNYIIRERHAHAWALVYHSDTEDMGTNRQHTFRLGRGAGKRRGGNSCRISFQILFSIFEMAVGQNSFAHYAERLLMPLILYLLVRIVTSQHRKALRGGRGDAGDPVWPGLDSELFVINRRLSELQSFANA